MAEPTERINLTGGPADGTVWAVSDPVLDAYRYAAPPSMDSIVRAHVGLDRPLNDIVIYEVRFVEDHRPSRNDRGELIYDYRGTR